MEFLLFTGMIVGGMFMYVGYIQSKDFSITKEKNIENTIIKFKLGRKSPKEQLEDLKNDIYNKMIELKSKRMELEYKLGSAIETSDEYKSELKEISKDELSNKMIEDKKLKYKVTRLKNLIKIKESYSVIVTKMKNDEEIMYDKFLEISEKLSLLDSHDIILDVNNILNDLNMKKFNLDIDINVEEEIRQSEIKTQSINEVNEMVDVNPTHNNDMEEVLNFIYK